MNKKIRQKTSKEDVAISMDRERSALIISEEKGAGNLIGAVLRNLGYQTKSCDSIEKAYKLYNKQSLVIFYSNSRKETIIQFLKKFNRENNHTKVSKYLVIGLAALALFGGINNHPGDNIAHFAHLGGMIFGFILLKIWQKNRNTFY